MNKIIVIILIIILIIIFIINIKENKIGGLKCSIQDDKFICKNKGEKMNCMTSYLGKWIKGFKRIILNYNMDTNKYEKIKKKPEYLCISNKINYKYNDLELLRAVQYIGSIVSLFKIKTKTKNIILIGEYHLEYKKTKDKIIGKKKYIEFDTLLDMIIKKTKKKINILIENFLYDFAKIENEELIHPKSLNEVVRIGKKLKFTTKYLKDVDKYKRSNKSIHTIEKIRNLLYKNKRENIKTINIDLRFKYTSFPLNIIPNIIDIKDFQNINNKILEGYFKRIIYNEKETEDDKIIINFIQKYEVNQYIKKKYISEILYHYTKKKIKDIRNENNQKKLKIIDELFLKKTITKNNTKIKFRSEKETLLYLVAKKILEIHTLLTDYYTILNIYKKNNLIEKENYIYYGGYDHYKRIKNILLELEEKNYVEIDEVPQIHFELKDKLFKTYKEYSNTMNEKNYINIKNLVKHGNMKEKKIDVYDIFDEYI